MTRYDIINMAGEAGLCWQDGEPIIAADRLKRFAALVAAAEREMCIANVFSYGGIRVYDALKIVETIRARGQK
jgi:hypothetical protein